jgi:exonuclease SbcC
MMNLCIRSNEVEVEFEFAESSQKYRIIRKHSRPKTSRSSGQTILEFQVLTEEGYKVLSGDTTTQTQQKINQILRMDYETFINSAFLRQGRADEFTKKRPNERKQVLSNILQLSVYDELEDRSKSLSKEQETVITQIESVISGMQDELSQKPLNEAEFNQAQSELLEAEKNSTAKELLLIGLRKGKGNLESKKAQLAELTSHTQDTERNYKLWNEQSLQCLTRIQSFEKLISQRSSIEENYRHLLDIRKQYQDMDLKFKMHNTLTQNQHKLEIIILKASEDLK